MVGTGEAGLSGRARARDRVARGRGSMGAGEKKGRRSKESLFLRIKGGGGRPFACWFHY